MANYIKSMSRDARFTQLLFGMAAMTVVSAGATASAISAAWIIDPNMHLFLNRGNNFEIVEGLGTLAGPALTIGAAYLRARRRSPRLES